MCNEVWGLFDTEGEYDAEKPFLFSTEQKAYNAMAEEVAELTYDELTWYGKSEPEGDEIKIAEDMAESLYVERIPVE